MMIQEFINLHLTTGQEWDLLMRDSKQLLKSPERGAKKILSGDYGLPIAKKFRDYVREKMGFIDGEPVENREAA